MGCRACTLAILIGAECPEACVVGMDGDPRALDVARRKRAHAGVAVRLYEGPAYQLSCPVASFDRVFSSPVLH